MSVSPDLETFKAKYQSNSPQVVWTTLVADLETSISAFMKLGAENEDYSCLLESVEGGAIRGRYTFIGLKPDIIWRCTGNRAEINRQPRPVPPMMPPISLYQKGRWTAFGTCWKNL